MFTGVFQDDIFIRLSEQDRSEITASNDEVVPFESGLPPKKGTKKSQ